MNRKTLLAGAVFAGLVLIAVVTLVRPEKGQRQGPGARPLATIKAEDFDTLIVTKSGVATTIKKTGGDYTVTAPVNYPADKDAAKTAFEAIEKLDFGTIISDQKAKRDEYEVGDKGLRVTVKKGEAVVADLHIGKVTNAQTLVRLEGKDEVWQALGSLKFSFDRDTSGWRDKSITTFDEKDAESIEVVAQSHGGGGAQDKQDPQDKILVEKAKSKDGGALDGAWTVKESTIKVQPFDKTVPSGIVNALASWKANDFADGVKLEEAGLDHPALTVTVKAKGGSQTVAIAIGKKKGDDDTYVKAADKPQIFLVKRYNLDRINKRPIEFREKGLCDLSESDLTDVSVTRATDSFALTRAGGAWKLAKPAGITLDPAKVPSVAGGLKDWKATSFAEDPSPKATGLDKPVATLMAKTKAATCALKIGHESPDKSGYFVEKVGTGDVLVAPKWSIDRILVKLDDLKKK